MRLLMAALVAGLSLANVAGVGAAPLDPATCDAAKSGHATLIAEGVKDDLAKGPQWAKANLDQARIERAKRFLTLEEQVKFRCPQPKPIVAIVAPNPVPAEATETPPPPRERKKKVAAPVATALAPTPPKKPRTTKAQQPSTLDAQVDAIEQVPPKPQAVRKSAQSKPPARKPAVPAPVEAKPEPTIEE